MNRIQAEYKDIRLEPPENVSAGPIDENDLCIWEATILGPSNSPYAGGIFKLNILFPNDYPFVSKSIQSLSRAKYSLRSQCFMAYVPTPSATPLLPNVSMLNHLVH